MACQFTFNHHFFLCDDPLGVEAIREPDKTITGISCLFVKLSHQANHQGKR